MTLQEQPDVAVNGIDLGSHHIQRDEASRRPKHEASPLPSR